jgi:hypothetical protein
MHYAWQARDSFGAVQDGDELQTVTPIQTPVAGHA